MGAGRALFHKNCQRFLKTLGGLMLERCDLHADLAALLVR